MHDENLKFRTVKEVEMKCKNRKMAYLIDKKVAGKMRPEDEAILLEHFKSCPDCRSRHEALYCIRIGFAVESIKAPATLTARVMYKIENTDYFKQNRVHENRPVFLRQVPGIALSLACMVLLVLVFSSVKHNATRTVKFSLQAPGAKEVSLVGDFNDWNENAIKLINKNGIWTTKVKLKPDRYLYMFLIDGDQWLPDPKAGDYIDDGYGNKNSIIDIRKT